MFRDARRPENGAEYCVQAHTVAAGGVTALSTYHGIDTLYTAGGDGSIAIWYIEGHEESVPRQPL